jgi:hypothetical protein
VSEHARRRTWAWVYPLAAILVVLYLWAGYAEGWAWTGFTGNTVWDWIKLLLLPLLLPTIVLPRLLDAAENWMAPARTTDPVARSDVPGSSTG